MNLNPQPSTLNPKLNPKLGKYQVLRLIRVFRVIKGFRLLGSFRMIINALIRSVLPVTHVEYCFFKHKGFRMRVSFRMIINALIRSVLPVT
jgi:hypothetical protein